MDIHIHGNPGLPAPCWGGEIAPRLRLDLKGPALRGEGKGVKGNGKWKAGEGKKRKGGETTPEMNSWLQPGWRDGLDHKENHSLYPATDTGIVDTCLGVGPKGSRGPVVFVREQRNGNENFSEFWRASGLGPIFIRSRGADGRRDIGNCGWRRRLW